MENKLYQIYIGQKDKETLDYSKKNQNLFEEYEHFLSQCKINFSKEIIDGGYISSNKEYIFEKSCCYSFVGIYNKHRVMKMIEELKNIFNQDSVLIIVKDVKSEIVKYEC